MSFKKYKIYIYNSYYKVEILHVLGICGNVFISDYAQWALPILTTRVGNMSMRRQFSYLVSRYEVGRVIHELTVGDCTSYDL